MRSTETSAGNMGDKTREKEQIIIGQTWLTTPNKACRFRNFFLGPIPELFFCKLFAAFPGNATNKVDPVDPTLFFVFPGNA